jgi:hypothetical protein
MTPSNDPSDKTNSMMPKNIKGLEKKNNIRYLKDKKGFKIEATDPVQDIMSDDELSDAEDRINSLLEDDSNDKH